MATFNKFNQFVEDLTKGVHNFSADTMKVMLSNTLPLATNSVRSDITELSTGGGYTSGGSTAAFVSVEQISGVLRLILADPTLWTASGAGFGPFRYIILYNDTPTSPADPLIGWWDYGLPVDMVAGETFQADFDGTTGVFTIT